MAKGKPATLRRQVPSKQLSCSELAEGNRKLLDIKQEKESPAELMQKIQDCCTNTSSAKYIEVSGVNVPWKKVTYEYKIVAGSHIL